MSSCSKLGAEWWQYTYILYSPILILYHWVFFFKASTTIKYTNLKTCWLANYIVRIHWYTLHVLLCILQPSPVQVCKIFVYIYIYVCVCVIFVICYICYIFVEKDIAYTLSMDKINIYIDIYIQLSGNWYQG